MHRIIRRAVLATTCLAAPIASGPALAQFNLYPAGATSVFVPYVNGPMNFVQNGVLMNRAPQLWVRLDAGSNIGTTALFTMDTGSTGIIASSEIFPTTGQQSLGSGSQYYSSSGVQLNGQFYATTVNIMNGNQPGSTAITTASVVALQAQTQTCRFANKGCQASAPGTLVSGVAYMGVGFDRGDSAITRPSPVPAAPTSIPSSTSMETVRTRATSSPTTGFISVSPTRSPPTTPS